MTEHKEEFRVIQRVPFWLAVALTVVISIPFGVFLGPFNIALWSSFIAWAEYFAFGAHHNALKYIYTLFPLCALWCTIAATLINYFAIYLHTNLVLNVIVWLFIWVAVMVYIMKYHQNFTKYSLAYFNGLSMYLAFYFAHIGPGLGGGPLINNPLVNPWILWTWCYLSAILGGFLGWLNIQLTFPKKVRVS